MWDETLTRNQRSLIRSAVENDVRFVIVGGYAVRFHGVARLTSDLDIVIDPTRDNVRALGRALCALGPTDLGEVEKLVLPRKRAYAYETDIFSELPEIPFARLMAQSVIAKMNGLRIRVISRADLMHAKRTASRDPMREPKDQAVDRSDLDLLSGIESRE